MARTRGAKTIAAAAVLLLTGCQAAGPSASVGQAETQAKIELQGQPPEGAVAIQVARQRRFHQLHLAPAALGEPIDVTRPAPRRTERFDVVVEAADGSRTQLTANRVQPLQIPYSQQPVTVTYTPAAGQPDSGTLTVELENGTVTGETQTGDSAPELDEHRVTYQVTLTWTDGDPGYAIVLRGPGTGSGNNQPGSSRHFTQDKEFHVNIGAGERMTIAVYPGFLDAEAAQSAPDINPAGGTSTIVAPAS